MLPFIKEISIAGFKSFADKTTIVFEEGLNMVVGPNGCGKSNIIDAFCWGLGESRLKNLRAQKTEDIIFGGTQKRSPSSFAQVSFVINNKQRILSVDADEVFIKRRLNRDGETQFFLNKKECRLKDIQKLFLDTGLGRNSYSIMQQGRIDQILTGKPEDRRAIFEEVAGISLSKVLVKESEQKLKKAEDNLKRLEDILTEVEVQVGTLYQQAQAAMSYRDIKLKIENLEKKIFFVRYIDLSLRAEKTQEKNTSLETQLKEFQESVKTFKEESQDIIENMGKWEEESYLLKEQEQKTLIDDARLGQKIELLRKDYEETLKDLKKEEDKKESMALELSSKTHQLKEMEIEREEFSLLLKEYQSELARLEKTLKESKEALFIKEENLQQITLSIKKEEKDLHENLLKQQEFFLSLFESLDNSEDDINSKVKNKDHYKKQILDILDFLMKAKDKWKSSLNNGENLSSKEIKSLFVDLKDVFHHIKIMEEYYGHYTLEVEGIISAFKGENSSLKKEENSKEAEKILIKLREESEQIAKEIKKYVDLQTNILNEQSEFQLKINDISQKEISYNIHIEKLREEVSFYEKNLTLLKDELSYKEGKKDLIQDEIFVLVEDYEKTQAERIQIRSQLEAITSQKNEKTLLLSHYQDKEKSLIEEISKIGDDLNKYYLVGKELAIEKEMVTNEYQNRYNQALDQALTDTITHELKEENVSIAKIQKQMREHKDILDDIGLVNLLAIDEYEDVKKRYDFLTKNKEDVLKTKTDLEALIENVNEKAQKDFLEVFEKLNENLNMIFKKAFEGGTCEVQLVDPSNPLKSGVDILAKPPGKKLQNLALLSGGERTMVALSLMFALFTIKPSPICVMDEVDAALDEVNIKRFLRILEDFYNHTQFLMISHNRITAQKGGVFYGVTMQETGVTKVFSFKTDNKVE